MAHVPPLRVLTIASIAATSLLGVGPLGVRPLAVAASTSRPPTLVLEVAHSPRDPEAASFDRFWNSTVLLYADGRLIVRVDENGGAVDSTELSDPDERNRPGPYRERRFRPEDVTRFLDEAEAAGVVKGGPSPTEPCTESLQSLPQLRKRVGRSSRFVAVGLLDCSYSQGAGVARDPVFAKLGAFVRELTGPTPFGRSPLDDRVFEPSRYLIAAVEYFGDHGAPARPWPLHRRLSTRCVPIGASTYRRSFAPLLPPGKGPIVVRQRGRDTALEIVPEFPGPPHRQCPLPAGA